MANDVQEDSDPKLRAFLRRELAAGKVQRFELRKVTPSGAEPVNETWASFAPERLAETVPEVLAREVWELAADDAEGLRGPTQYACMSFVDDRPRGRVTFRIASGDKTSSDIEESEPATAAGLLTKLMRHLENKERSTYGIISEILSRQNQALDRLTARNDKLESRYLQTIDLMEQITSEAHKRELEARRVELDAERRDRFGARVELLLPLAVNRLLGGKGGVAPLGGDLIKELVASLQPEQIEKLMSTLSPEQALAFAELKKGGLEGPVSGEIVERLLISLHNTPGQIENIGNFLNESQRAQLLELLELYAEKHEKERETKEKGEREKREKKRGAA